MRYTSNTIKLNKLFLLCIVLLFGVFIAKLSYVALSKIVEGTDLKTLAENRSLATRVLKAERGNIYDKSGELLAQTVNSYTLVAILSPSRTTDKRFPKHVDDKELTAKKLAEFFASIKRPVTYEYILDRLKENKYQVEFGQNGKGLTETDKKAIDALALPGIEFTKTTKRYYQNGDFASYIIGYAVKKEGTDEFKGELGIEGFANKYLSGKDGKITYQKDAYGYQIAGENKTYVEPAVDGYDVYLTIDKKVQIFLDNTLKKFVENDPEWVSITIADAKTGAIVASSTSPSFNPNTREIAIYNNPLTSFTYEPGSTMKIFSFMSAIEEQKYKGDELYQSGSINVDDYRIRDWNKTGWGKISYDTGFTYSSNIAAVNLGLAVGKKGLTNYYQSLGFGEKTGIELANELSGEFEIKYKTELAAASYGHGLTITPIQMIQALTNITNDGVVLKPYVIDKIMDHNTQNVVYEGKRTEVKKVYSTSTVNKIIDLMDMVVNSEDKAVTGAGYHTDAVRLIGKTGTAYYTGPDGQYITGTYRNIRSFAGVFPKENPEYIIYVVAKDFKGTSRTMGTIIKELVESVSKYRNLDERPSDKDESKIVTIGNFVNQSTISSVAKLNALKATPIVLGDGDRIISQYPKKGTKTSQKSKVFLVTNGNDIKMPNIKGWSYSEFVDFCMLIGVKYEIDGYGYVESVSIPEGSIIDKDSTIYAKLQNINPIPLNDVSELEGEQDEEN